MGFIKALIRLIVLAVVLIFAFVNNDLATFNLWPFYIEVTVSLSVAIVFFIVIGFIWAKIDSWIGYAPLRRQLRHQKKQNKKLSKEQQKLAKEVEGLHENLTTMKEKEASQPKPPLKQRIVAWFKRNKKEQ